MGSGFDDREVFVSLRRKRRQVGGDKFVKGESTLSRHKNLLKRPPVMSAFDTDTAGMVVQRFCATVRCGNYTLGAVSTCFGGCKAKKCWLGPRSGGVSSWVADRSCWEALLLILLLPLVQQATGRGRFSSCCFQWCRRCKHATCVGGARAVPIRQKMILRTVTSPKVVSHSLKVFLLTVWAVFSQKNTLEVLHRTKMVLAPCGCAALTVAGF